MWEIVQNCQGSSGLGARSFQVWTVRSRADVTMKTTPEPRLEGREAAGLGSSREADPGNGAPGIDTGQSRLAGSEHPRVPHRGPGIQGGTEPV